MATIEEKAKAYDIALEKIEMLLGSGSSCSREELEYVFPELKESKDEKIRKDIMDYLALFKEQIGEEYETWVAWFEKQAEQKPLGFNIGDEITVNGQICKVVAVEQKPADKVEPKFKVKYAGSEYNVFDVKDIAGVTFYGIEDEPNHIDYVQAENCERVGGYSIKENGSPYPTKSAVFAEHNSAWSEEDEINLGKAIWYVENPSPMVAKNAMLVEWLKNLRGRVQPQHKQEWSEEDRKLIDETCGLINTLASGYGEKVTEPISFSGAQQISNIKTRLRALVEPRPQSHWKPSEGQLECLGYAIEKAEKDWSPLTNNRIYLTLKALKEQLEKL